MTPPNPSAGMTVENPPVLYGLVLAGGESRRMGQDKAALPYQGEMLSRHQVVLLSTVCHRVFLSNRREQADDPGHQGLPQIHDVAESCGPLGGILSAMQAWPEAAWLVLACDMPYVDAAVLHHLVLGRNPARLATTFHYSMAGFDEPMCTIYEPACRPYLEAAKEQNCLSPRDVLASLDIERLTPLDDRCLRGINTPAEYHRVVSGHDTPPGTAR